MRSFRWMKVMWVGVGVAAVCVPVEAAAAAAAKGMQVAAGQRQDHQRMVEAEVTVSVLLADGRYVAVINAVKELASPSAALLNEEGVAYEHLGGMDNAKSCYEESMKLDPKSSNVYNNLGTIYHARHDPAMAMRLYKKAIKLDGKSASAYKNLGAAYFNRGNFRRGAEAFEDALRIDPTVLDRQGLVMDAEDAGTLISMNYFLAQLCARSGRTDAAIAYLNRAIAQGFKDYGKLQKDDAFAAVRGMAEFPARAISR